MLHIHFAHRPFFLSWVQRRPREENVGWMFLVLAILSGSTYNTFAKSLTGAFSPFSLIFVSEVLTLFFLLLSFGTIPLLRQIAHVKKHMIFPLLTIGVFSGTLAPLLWFSGLHTTTAINAALFGNAEILFILILATFTLGEKWTSGKLAAAGSIILGLITIALQGFTTGIQLYMGDFFILLAALCFSIGSITFRKYLHHTYPQVAIVTRSVTAITVFFLLSPFQQHPFITEIKALPETLFLALLGFGFISKFLNVFSFYQSIDRLPVTTTSMFGSLTVIVSVLFAHATLGEPIAWYHLLGGFLIVGGTILLELFGAGPVDKTDELRERLHQRA